MSIKNLNIFLLCSLLLEMIYFDIVFDIVLILLLVITAFLLGSFIQINFSKKLDEYLVKFVFGLGLLGVLLWASTLNVFNYKSLYLLLSISLILLRFNYLKTFYKDSIRFIRVFNKTLFFPMIISFLIIYLIPASYPVWPSDATVKHLVIPFSILDKSNWDYNVIEHVSFGDYALLPHMFYLYLAALGGIKSIVIFSIIVSSTILFSSLRIARNLSKSKLLTYIISLIYLTTPMLVAYSTKMYVDLIPIMFVMIVILFLNNKKTITSNDIYIMAFLLGCAFFAKQQAAFYILPISLLIIIKTYKNYKNNKLRFIFDFFIALLVFLIPFFPAMAIIWYKTGNPFFPFLNGLFKSPYFPQENFSDPFKNPLFLNIKSLFSIVFNTSKNTEFTNGGLGVFLLLILLVPLNFILKFNKKLFALSFICIVSYTFSTMMTYNIRYFIGSIIIALILGIYTLVNLLDNYFRSKKINLAILFTITIILFSTNLFFLYEARFWAINRAMLKPDKRIALVENEEILSQINNKNVRLLTNDISRGIFKGQYYTLHWYNNYLINKVNNGQITHLDLLNSFDYFLYNKIRAWNIVPFFDDYNNFKSMVSVVEETDTLILYKINRKYDEKSILSENFNEPIKVTESKHEVREFNNLFKKYKINIEAQKYSEQKTIGRWQINWHDEEGRYISSFLTTFELDENKKHYTSKIIDDIPANAKKGMLYISSHDEMPILIYSYKLVGLNKDFLTKELDNYNKKWPHLQ